MRWNRLVTMTQNELQAEIDAASDFELIRSTLFRMDPETRHQVIGAMIVIRTMPIPVAVRVLASAAARERLLRSPIIRPLA